MWNSHKRAQRLSGTRKMSVWELGVCQSRNWEAFWVDLWGQGLPKAPLQNNSGPGSWLWDRGCCSDCLENTQTAPTSLPLSSSLPSRRAQTEPFESGNWRKQRQQLSPCRYDLSGMWQCFTVCEQTCLWCQIQWTEVGGFCQQQFNPYHGTGTKLFTVKFQVIHT